jgi:hypothetical protein
MSWDDALADLRRLIPGEVDYASPDRLWAAADALAGPAEVRELPGWEDLQDIEILDRIYAGLPPLIGPVIVVTDRAFSPGESPIRLEAERLREFVAGYFTAAGECFFDGGDVIILATDARRLTILHHEGVFVHWDLGLPDKTSGRIL